MGSISGNSFHLALIMHHRNSKKEWKTLFREKKWALVYIDDILICSKKFQEHLKHIQEFYSLVFKHGLVLSKSKTEIGKKDIEFLGYKISKGQVILQEHVCYHPPCSCLCEVDP